MAKKSNLSRRSIAAQALHAIDEATGAVVPPINQATTFARDENYDLKIPASYARSLESAPTVAQVEEVLAVLEGGEAAMLFSAGMGAVAALFEILREGDHVVAPQVMYHGGLSWLKLISERRGIEYTLFDQTQDGALEAAIRPGSTKLVWIESPVNPTWDVIDVRAAAAAAHSVGAILAVDATVVTPALMRPLELGADIVFHSATKYLNGHSDVLAGVLICSEKNDIWDEIKINRLHLGSVLSPFGAWLLLRGMRTLYVRVETSSRNALAIAKHFENHPKLEAVLYPGLESHPRHEIAARQMDGGFGGMMSFLVKGGIEDTKTVTTALKLFIPATSLGGVESLAEHRKIIEGPDSLVAPNLIRLSVGIEDAGDLIADLEQALDRI